MEGRIQKLKLLWSLASANVARTMIMQEMSKIINKYKMLFDTYIQYTPIESGSCSVDE